MRDRHILEILDETPFADLGGEELKTVQLHCAECAGCRQAFDAARISAALLTARADAAPAFEPNAFFQSKVLNAIREKQAVRTPIAAFWRWWQASYPLVCSMLFIVATLAALTLFAPRSNADDQAISTYNLYTTDAVILNQRAPQSLTTEQTLEVIYTERRGGGKR